MRRFLMLSLALGACGDEDGAGRLPDAAPISDAPTVQPVTLTVTRNGMPVSGVHVYFLNADDSVVATADTNAAGTASAVMAAGGSVTALDPFPTVRQVPQVVEPGRNNDLRTFVGVEPGDHLVLTQNDPPSVDVTILAPDEPKASQYEVRTTCGSGSIPVRVGSGGGNTVTLAGCGASADIMLVALDSASGLPVSYLYHPNADLSKGAVDLTSDALKPVSVVSFDYKSIPAGTNSIGVFHSLVAARGPIQQPFETSVGFEGSSGGASILEPAIAGTTGIVDTRVQLNSLHHVVDWGAVTASYTLDLAGLLLPDLVDPPQFNATTQRLSWTETRGGAAPDLTVTQIDVGRNDGLQNWRWTVAAPYTPGEIKFPKLPTDVFDWAPAPQTDFVTVMGLTSAKTPGGYDAARAHVLDVFESHGQPPSIDPRKLAGAAAGRAVLVDMQQPLGVLRRNALSRPRASATVRRVAR